MKKKSNQSEYLNWVDPGWEQGGKYEHWRHRQPGQVLCGELRCQSEGESGHFKREYQSFSCMVYLQQQIVHKDFVTKYHSLMVKVLWRNRPEQFIIRELSQTLRPNLEILIYIVAGLSFVQIWASSSHCS